MRAARLLRNMMDKSMPHHTQRGFDAAGMKKRNMMNYVIGGGIMASVFGVYTYSLGAVPQENFSDVVAADRAGIPDGEVAPKV